MTWLKRGIESTLEEVFMRNIGVSSLEEVNDWFRKSNACGYRIDRMDEAVELAKGFKDQQVTIVGDYDGDGVTSTSILYLALKMAGFKHIRYRIPKRFSEGFGINMAIIDEISEGLVITCDNGVAQPEAINAAKAKGLTVIIIDHHEPIVENGTIVLPDADIIIDPNAIEGSADFNGYCGAGLSYKFALALLGNDRKKCRHLLSLAAIGTVTDVVELRQENYVFVRNGLAMLTNPTCTTTGAYALVSAFNLTRHISEGDIGFKIGPALNAASRMQDDGAMEAVELLTFDGDYVAAIALAEKLVAKNEQRKIAKKDGMDKVQDIININCMFSDVPLVIYVPDICEGVIGILAGNICEEYQVPAIVLTDSNDPDVLKGSARACGNYNMKQELDKCSSLLLRYGGHAGAAGLSLKRENVDALREMLNVNAEGYSFEDAGDVGYDLEIKASDIPNVLKELSRFAPFGAGNDQIVFKIDDFSLVPRYGAYKKLMGADESIVKLFSSNSIAIGFGMGERMKSINSPRTLSLVGVLSENYFNGSVENQVEFMDYKEKQAVKVETPLANKLKAMAMSR